MEIYFSDLNPEAQAKVLEFYKLENSSDGNFDVFPLATLECSFEFAEDEDEVEPDCEVIKCDGPTG